MINEVFLKPIEYSGKIGDFSPLVEMVTGRIVDELLGTEGELLIDVVWRIRPGLECRTGP